MSEALGASRDPTDDPRDTKNAARRRDCPDPETFGRAVGRDGLDRPDRDGLTLSDPRALAVTGPTRARLALELLTPEAGCDEVGLLRLRARESGTFQG